jgi:hypothetical protein
LEFAREQEIGKRALRDGKKLDAFKDAVGCTCINNTLRTLLISALILHERLTRFREMREIMGLIRTRKQGHDVDSIREAMLRLRAQHPKAGQHEIRGCKNSQKFTDKSAKQCVHGNFCAPWIQSGGVLPVNFKSLKCSLFAASYGP